MTQLRTLRSQITALRRRRRTARLSTGLAALAVAVLWGLLAVYAIDALLAVHAHVVLDVPQRLVLIALAVGGIVWAYLRYTKPFLGIAESDIDVALLVERKHSIDSDLVAAMQFETPEAATWGSQRLEEAVINYVAELGPDIDVFDGFANERFRRRATVLGVTAAFAVLITVLWPGHMVTYLNHLALGGMHYPSHTQILRVLVNGRLIELEPGAMNRVPCPFGDAVEFEALCGGVIPGEGRVELRTISSGREAEVELVPSVSGGETQDDPALFAGRLPRLLDAVRFQLYLGDAYTDPATIELIPLPVIQPRLHVTSPDYADVENEENSGTDTLQVAVIEGSRVELELIDSSKPLRDVTLTVEGLDEPLQLGPVNSERTQWRLSVAGTPLADIREPLRFTLDVTDDDGLNLAAPLRGYVRLKIDRPPRIAARFVHRRVHPRAHPVIDLIVLDDDFGVAQLLVHVQISRANQMGPAEKHTIPVERFVQRQARSYGEPNAVRYIYEAVEYPLRGGQLPVKSRGVQIDLEPLALRVGDQIKLTLEAIDYRGQQPGESSLSEPLVAEVTDANGIWAMVAEADEISEEQLTELITELLGTGESP